MSRPFRHIADERLADLRMDERLKQAVRARAAVGRRRLVRRRTLRLAVVMLLLLMTATAFALTRGFGLFELMGTVMPHFSQVRPEAEELVRRDLSSFSFPHVDVAVREAAYDGRYLRVAYSVIDRAATAPLEEPGTDLTSDREEIFRFVAAQQDDIRWTTLDWAEVGGEHVNPLGMSFSVAGPNNGEAITWVQFDVRGLSLPDTFTVRLPLRGADTPHELDFTMDKGDMRHVYRLVPPPDKRIGNYIISIQEVIISPIRTYITAHLIVDPGVPPQKIWEIADRWMSSATLADEDGGNPQRWTDTGAGAVDNMDWVRISLPDGSFDFEDRIVDPEKPVTMKVIPEYAPPDVYPEAFRFGHSEQDFILIPFVKLRSPERDR